MALPYSTVNSRLVHSCIGLGQQRSLQSLRKVTCRYKRPLRNEDAASPTIAEHWNLVARLHAKRGIYVEFHAWSFTVRGVWKMPCYMLRARECFHVIDSMATDVHTLFSFICRIGRLSMCSPRASLDESKNVYVIAGQTRWDVAAKRPKAIWMTHTKSTLLLLLLLLFIVHCTRTHIYLFYWRHLLASEPDTQNHFFIISNTRQDAFDQAKHHRERWLRHCDSAS